MNIKIFNKSDELSVITLWQKCDLIVPSNNPKLDIERKLLVDPHLFLVGEIAGFVIATVMGGYEGHRGWINYLAVHPDHRCNGYGKKLMLEIEQRLKNQGCPKINLQIRSDNSDAVSFYQKIGFLNDNVIGLGKRLIDDEKFID